MPIQVCSLILQSSFWTCRDTHFSSGQGTTTTHRQLFRDGQGCAGTAGVHRASPQCKVGFSFLNPWRLAGKLVMASIWCFGSTINASPLFWYYLMSMGWACLHWEWNWYAFKWCFNFLAEWIIVACWEKCIVIAGALPSMLDKKHDKLQLENPMCIWGASRNWGQNPLEMIIFWKPGTKYLRGTSTLGNMQPAGVLFCSLPKDFGASWRAKKGQQWWDRGVARCNGIRWHFWSGFSLTMIFLLRLVTSWKSCLWCVFLGYLHGPIWVWVKHGIPNSFQRLFSRRIEYEYI